MRIHQPIIRFLIFALVLLQFGACSKDSSVLEETSVSVNIELNYSTSEPLATKYYNDDVKVRYIIRVYPVDNNKVSKNHCSEIVSIKDCSEIPDGDFSVNLNPGSYCVMAWSDFLVNGKPLHNADDFGEISLLDKNIGSTVYSETYRGECNFNVSDSLTSLSLGVNMLTPQASFELVATDFADFISENSATNGSISLKDYTVVFYYVGFVPTAYSMYTDRPVDSSTGIKFISSMDSVSDTRVSLGLDYVFVNEKNSLVTVRVGVYDKNNELVALTGTIKVPLKRGCKSVLIDDYLNEKNTDGVVIDPNFDGNFNLIFK